jgi:hypothetical protein
MIDSLTVRRLLDGVRGAPPVDVSALAEAIVRLSYLAVDLGDRIDALDANPIIVGSNGCTIVDALVEPRGVTKART